MAPNYGAVRVIAGSGAGKTLRLQKLVTVIGSGKEADLRLEGEKVAENHASIESSADGTCVIRNRSPFGTLVNKTRIDVQRLADGDRIQIGAAALLEFQGPGTKAAAAGGASQTRKMLIGVGLGVYLLAMLAVAVKLSSMHNGEGGGVGAAALDVALNETRTALTSPPKKPPGQGDIVPADPTDPSAAYYRVVNAQARGAPATEVASAADALIELLRGHLQEGSALERQERWKNAQDEYRDVLEMLPDLRLPAATLAANRLSVIREKLPDEQ